MKKKRLKRIIHYKDNTFKQLKLFREKFNTRYFEEIHETSGIVRKQPPQYNPHK